MSDESVSSQLGGELQRATYPQADPARFVEARDRAGAWSYEARSHLAVELRSAQALMVTAPDTASGLVDGVIAALEDRR